MVHVEGWIRCDRARVNPPITVAIRRRTHDCEVSIEGLKWHPAVSGSTAGTDRRQRVTVWLRQFWMIKWRSFVTDTFIRQRLHERNDRVNVRLRKVQREHLRGEVNKVRLMEVAAAIVELHHLPQRGLAAIVKVRSGQFDIA